MRDNMLQAIRERPSRQATRSDLLLPSRLLQGLLLSLSLLHETITSDVKCHRYTCPAPTYAHCSFAIITKRSYSFCCVVFLGISYTNIPPNPAGLEANIRTSVHKPINASASSRKTTTLSSVAESNTVITCEHAQVGSQSFLLISL